MNRTRVIGLVFLIGLAAGEAPAWAQLTVEKGDFKLTFSGRVVLEAGVTTNPSAPAAVNGFTLYAAPRPPEDRTTSTLSGRQTGITLLIEPPAIGSFEVTGIIDMNLMGSDPGSGAQGAFFGAALIDFQNDSWRFAFGRFGALLAPLSSSVINWGGLDAGGDLNALAPRDQARIEYHSKQGSVWLFKFQGAITNPEQEFLTPQPDRVTGNAGIPNFEGRLFVGYGEESDAGERLVEVGVSGMRGRLRGDEAGIRIEDDSWAAALDYALRRQHFGILGEIWSGRGLGHYGGGISQSASETSLRLLRTNI